MFFFLAYFTLYNRLQFQKNYKEKRKHVLKTFFMRTCKIQNGLLYVPSDPCSHCIFFSIFIFLMWTIFKGFTEFVTILLPFYISVFWPQDMWYLSFPRRDQIGTPFIERLSLNHWPIREVPSSGCYFSDQLQL